MTHDPLCPNTTLHMDSGEPQRIVINCQCALIARAHADEREQIKAEFLAGGGSKQSAELFSIAYDRGYTDAMRDMEAFVSDLREERSGNG